MRLRWLLTSSLLSIPLLFGAGCGKNSATTVLVPTGIRPSPTVGTGTLKGFVTFDSLRFYDPGLAPFPAAKVELWDRSRIVAETLTTRQDRSFAFHGLVPGIYSVVVASADYESSTHGPFRVVEVSRDAGDLALKTLGSLSGTISFDPGSYPGLDRAPFPVALVTLLRGATTVAETLTTPLDPTFTFKRLPSGRYQIRTRSHAFSPGLVDTIAVANDVRDLGQVRLQANTRDSLASLVFVVGTMPGFGTDEIGSFTTYCDAIEAGRWTYPNVLFTPVSVTAGTYRLKFVTDASSTPGHLIGWGGDGVTTLTAPVVAATARFGTEASSDLVVNFPVTGVYEFIFDERRLTIDIRLIPPGIAPRTAAGVASNTRRLR